jgi:hypothetical protein
MESTIQIAYAGIRKESFRRHHPPPPSLHKSRTRLDHLCTALYSAMGWEGVFRKIEKVYAMVIPSREGE